MFKRSLITTSIVGVCLMSTGSYGEDYTLDSDKKTYSYAIGTKIAGQIMAQFAPAGDQIDMEALAHGVNHILSSQQTLISEQEANAALEKQQKIEMEKAAQATQELKQKGDEFRKQNAQKDGVVETASGLQYEVINAGDPSGVPPTLNDTVVVHYQGTLIDGTVFDSSYQRNEPATFSLGAIVDGWKEALQLMRAGDKWNVVLPPELAYGERGAGQLIGPNETLLFEIELLEVKKSQN